MTTIQGAEIADATHERLLDAAEALFAERGFAASSVRDITAAAGCNVAAVNYYYGGKAALYQEVFRRRLRALREYRIDRIRELLAEGASQVSLKQLLRTFTNAFLEPLVDRSAGRRTVQLMAHEIPNPQLPPGMLVEEMKGPVQETLAGALMRVCPGLGRDAAVRCVHCLVGQLVLAIHAHKLFGEGTASTVLDLPAMVEHIVLFSAAGIEACRDGGSPS